MAETKRWMDLSDKERLAIGERFLGRSRYPFADDWEHAWLRSRKEIAAARREGARDALEKAADEWERTGETESPSSFGAWLRALAAEYAEPGEASDAE